MTPMPVVALLLAAAFGAGFGAGLVFCELRRWRRARRHTGGMGPGTPPRDRTDDNETQRGRWSFRSVVLLLIALVLVVNAVLGFLLIAARAATKHEQEQRDALVRCIAGYNHDEGKALSERDTRASLSTAANLEWLADFQDQVEHPLSDQAAARRKFLRSLSEYQSELRKTQETRARNAYPAFDRCSHLAQQANGKG